MPRLPRVEVEGAVFYVTSKGLQGTEIFKEKADYQMYLDLLTKYKAEHKFKLYAYTLLPNKISLLIETGQDATISEIMHDLNSLYTKVYNGRYNVKGHLFEARFKSVLVEKAVCLLEATREIHLEALRENSTHPYTSFLIYREGGAEKGMMADEVKEVLEFLKNKDNKAEYEKYCLTADPKEIAQIQKKLSRGGVLGSEEFGERVKNRVQEYFETQKAESTKTSLSKTQRTVLVMAGAVVLLASASAVYLYISKSAIQNQYQTLLDQREALFLEEAKFEKKSPIALTELESTMWEIEWIPGENAQIQEVIKDKISFRNGRFESRFLASKGFGPGSYFLVPEGQGIAKWQSAQSSPKGETVSWSGDWRGDVMKGVVSLRAGGIEQSFSFYSGKWSYVQ